VHAKHSAEHLLMIPNQVPTDIASEIVRRYDNVAKNRGNWESQWEEIAKRILPQYSSTFVGLESTPLNQGQRKTEYMVDSTGARALPKFAAAMESMLTPRNSTWHRLAPMDKTLKRSRAVMQWYDLANQKLFDYRYAPRANFAAQMHEGYMGLGAFGTDCMFIDALKGPRGEKGIRYRNIHLGEIHFLENHQGIIDTAIRKFSLTPRQAEQWFPGQLPDEIATKAKDAESQTTPYWFLHWVGPREDLEAYDPERKDVKGMHYGSYYVSITGKKQVKEGGYHVFPYPISRYVVAPGEVYGRSPAMLVLPSIKVLNEQKKTVLKQGHRVVDPVLLAHDDGVLAGFSMAPGDVNFGGVTADGKALVHVLPTGDLHLAKEMMEEERDAINDGFLVSLFQILIDTPQMTATEVLERAREKGILLSPTMGRQQSEFLGPMIERELDVLAEQGLLPPMPMMLKQARAEYKAEYDSPLSRAQKAENAAGFMQTINFVRDIIAVTQDPSPMDNFDFDIAVPAVADIQAVPTSWMASPEKIATARAARAKAQQTEQAIKAGPAAASVAKALPQLKLNGQNAAPAA
jgi:hypothetical protein